MDRRKIINIKIKEGYFNIPVRDICYVESMGHTLRFHVFEDGKSEMTYSCYSSLSKIEAELADSGFLRIQKSFLVNMSYIKTLNCKEAVMKNGAVIKVSKKAYGDCKRRYLLWRGE